MSNKQSMDYDDLGDRMKMYEGQEAGRHFIPHRPIIARMDGRAFHMFARDLEKPYDSRMMESMRNVTTALVHETNAIVGYTQSDEITLVWAPPKNQKEQLDLIHEAGESWESQLAAFKRGSYVSRQRVSTPFTTEEFNALPERHHARTNPDLVVDRVVIKTLELPRITTVVNRNDVIFRGAEPVVATENAECSAG